MATYYIPSAAGWSSPSVGDLARFRFLVTTSYDVANNRSTVTVSVQSYCTAYNGSGTVLANGHLYAQGNSIYTFVAGDNTKHTVNYTASQTWATLTSASSPNSWSFTVDHDSNGDATVTVGARYTVRCGNSFSAECGVSDQWGETQPVYGTLSLHEDRLSEISASNGYFGTAVPITITRRNNSFTHTVTTSCLGQTETVVNKGSSTSLSWTPAVATYAPLIPNAMSATATITCTTYNGNTALGSTSVTITLSLRAADVTPSTSIATSDPTGYLSTYGAYVATKSKIRVALTNSLKHGATLSAVQITANGESFSSSPAVSSEIVSTSYTSVTAKIKDTRAQWSATATATISILAYSQPTINSMGVIRCNSDGSANNAGAYMKVSYSVTVTALNNHNSKTLQVKFKKASASSYSTQSITLSAYTASGSVVIAADTNSSYDVQLVLSDDFSTSTVVRSLQSAATHINHGAGINGGIGIGKVSEADKTIEIASDWSIKYGADKIRGKAYYLGRADTDITSGADLNSYESPGVYCVGTNVIAASLANCPSSRGGTLRVWNTLGNTHNPGETWYYVSQEYTNVNGLVWRRRGETGSGTTVVWGDWTRFGENDSSSGYCKMPDGTLMCWGSKTYDISGKTAQFASTSKYWYVECVEDIVFPVYFVDEPSLQVTKTYGGVCAVGWVGLTQGKITEIDFIFPEQPTLTGFTPPNIKWLAIGRWKA